MELGEKLRRARLEAGLSQRQLCGEEITRNMLSLIENGTAKPSMKTLQYLAGRLGKSVSYFLEEDAVVSSNQTVMTAARQLYDEGNYGQAAKELEAYRGPDGVYDRERGLLWVLIHLALAEKALEEGRKPYARELLEKADRPVSYCAEALQHRRWLLLGRAGQEGISGQLPGLDEELMLRAREAFSQGNRVRAAALLEAMEQQASPQWQILRGDIWAAEKGYEEAARCFHQAEATFPKETAARLELCYRELQDYRRAYEYACRQRE